MPTGHGAHGVPGMSSAGEQHGAGNQGAAMAMTFIQSLTTPLLWSSWRPKNAAEYGASCLFLVALAALTRGLVAIRPVLNTASWPRRLQYHHHQGEDRNNEQDGDPKNHLPRPEHPVNGGRAVLLAIQDYWSSAALSTKLARAAFDTLIAGLGYLV